MSSTHGRELWNAFAADLHGEDVRLVCPTYERDRAEFAHSVGLAVAESWWLFEVPGSGGGEAGAQIMVPGADALTVGAPPVYAPPGPILFLRAVMNADLALPEALSAVGDLGCAAIVVNLPHRRRTADLTRRESRWAAARTSHDAPPAALSDAVAAGSGNPEWSFRGWVCLLGRGQPGGEPRVGEVGDPCLSVRR